MFFGLEFVFVLFSKHIAVFSIMNSKRKSGTKKNFNSKMHARYYLKCRWVENQNDSFEMKKKITNTLNLYICVYKDEIQMEKKLEDTSI